MIHLVIGGARSGKSRYAEQVCLLLASADEKSVTYIATATAIDEEMVARINRHQLERDKHWKLVECPLLLAEQIAKTTDNNIYLIDCLTLWLNNLIFSLEADILSDKDAQIAQKMDDLVFSLSNSNNTFVIVTNEVGQGIIPIGETSRLFVDHSGWMNQKLAVIADKVTLVVAGLPLILKNKA
ncbi:MAG: bifunctional adenosylcobinamide kinase/adenosylcobinamide-phosphate guanylyltransferase [Colwellia sp.]|nr:bifunctional adenosylcobinamide kinase/adenosylcobinamide-phosphate guanylyltransferase [Colwellia sp.]